MEQSELKAILQALLFVSTEPVGAGGLREVVLKGRKKEEVAVRQEEETDPLAQLQNRQADLEGEISAGEIKDALQALIADYQGNDKGIELVEVAKGYQFRTKAIFTPYINHFFEAPKTRISTPGMETLAIVAYQQPIARSKIEEIRGVDSGGVLKTLLDRDLVRIVGKSEEPGRPILYGTTLAFLELFGLNTLSDLPTLKDLEALGTQTGPAAEAVSDEVLENAVAEEEDFAPIDEESAGLVDELENSMRSLKDLERNIFPDEVKKEDQQS